MKQEKIYLATSGKYVTAIWGLIFIYVFANSMAVLTIKNKANYINEVLVYIQILFMILIAYLSFKTDKKSSEFFNTVTSVKDGLLLNSFTSTLLTYMVLVVAPILMTIDSDLLDFLGVLIFFPMIMMVHAVCLSLLPEIVIGSRSFFMFEDEDGEENL